MEINEKKKSVVWQIANDLRESTRNMNEINKAHLKAVRADSKASFKAATEPNPDFKEFKETKGLKNKVKVAVRQIKYGAKTNSEKERQKRFEIKKHSSYEKLLEEQRKRKAINS